MNGRIPSLRIGFHRRTSQEVFLSVLTLGELRRGVARLHRRDPKTARIIGTFVT